MNAGGLAQMSYNGNSNSLPFPGSGFASRGRASHVPRLSVNPPTIIEHEAEGTPAPRTSRSHLLAGLRTARKDSGSVPLSAPFGQTRFGENNNVNNQQRDYAPQTARAPSFGGINSMGMQQQQQQPPQQPQAYSRPDQILSPPGLNFGGSNDPSGMDPSVYQNLVATNAFLAQRQQMLQQQLMNVQAVAQQFGGMNISQQQQQGGFYNQQLQNGMQPIVQPVPNNPGIYQVYNPMTGQTSYYPEQVFQQQHTGGQSFGNGAQQERDNSASGRRSVTPPKNSASAGPWNRHFSPPRQSPSPPQQQDPAPLPEPSANAFRPGHRKSMSSANRLSVLGGSDAAKNALRSPGFPQTPVDGTFGLGLGRAGEHPVRQPRGPPPLEELVALPTSKHEGSKNFAARQRRRALFSLVRAGNDRRAGGRPGSASGEGHSSASENESPVVMSSDGDSETTGNTLSATTSIGSLKAVAAADTGKDAKADSFARRVTGSGSSNDADEQAQQTSGERRRTPMLVLTSAEKRRSPPATFAN